MKVIGSIKEIFTLDGNLAKFIIDTCPWVRDEWDPTRIGFVFVLSDSDINKIKCLNIAPHLPDSDGDPNSMPLVIDLEKFDLWEKPAIYDAGYWNLVAILGQEFGCAVFMSTGFVSSIPNLLARLQKDRT